MLMVCLPSADKSGTCKINGQKCEFKLTTRDGTLYFCFRPACEASAQWDVRQVVTAQSAGKRLTSYICGDNDGIPITVLTPVLREDGTVDLAVIKEETE